MTLQASKSNSALPSLLLIWISSISYSFQGQSPIFGGYVPDFAPFLKTGLLGCGVNFSATICLLFACAWRRTGEWACINSRHHIPCLSHLGMYTTGESIAASAVFMSLSLYWAHCCHMCLLSACALLLCVLFVLSSRSALCLHHGFSQQE